MKSLLGKLGVILIIGLAIFIYGEVRGAEWKSYFCDNEESDYYDSESLVVYPNGTVRVWTKTEYTTRGVDVLVKRKGEHFKKANHRKALEEHDCVEGRFRFLRIIYYSKSGEVMEDDDEPSNWFFIVPESMGDTLFQAVCKK